MARTGRSQQQPEQPPFTGPKGVTVPQPFNLSRSFSDPYEKPEPKPIPAFKARPVPKSMKSTPRIPDKPLVSKTTEFKPFNLRSETLHGEHIEWKEKLLKDKERKEEAARKFKARPVSSGVYKPFSPTKAVSPMTSEKHFMLETDLRAEMRAKYDEAMKEKMEEQTRHEEESLKKQAELDAQAVKELRQSQQFKAREMPTFSRPWTPRIRDCTEDEAAREAKDARVKEVEKAAREFRKSLDFKALKMPDFTNVWDPRSERRKSMSLVTAKQQSPNSSIWGRMSRRDVVDPITPVKSSTLGPNYLEELMSGGKTSRAGSTRTSMDTAPSSANTRPSTAPTYVQTIRSRRSSKTAAARQQDSPRAFK
mmetsp:Transcript_17429/g.37932  ORF Transcript_17429/g.37932 Transcript_17429/m.37932 type:complete len:365 (-) Transcript_17429:252-1346(-)|eukprot:CAMPEP_0118934478 /NCGR_PEP_ID=MMETSP1169-20130426/13845_1 /TAXON_ID=36882 /ORGANISM="Pyramimonas obovata, Strain CCMP722" /LENGTH=364 /DNA_ID=CAMNT_0006877385 /DNA_START=218 /DNA_END=1312 /DNA_ORIENTATION=+